MIRHLSMSQLTLLVAGLVLFGGLLIIFIYAVHKLFRSGREQRSEKSSTPRPADETAFALATMQSVITSLRAREKELKELLHETEQRAEAGALFLECVVREVPLGLMIINREGFLTLSNSAVRTLLTIDTWSRRRYPEVLGPESPLTACIRECLETGKEYKREPVEHLTARGETCLLAISLCPVCTQSGEVEGVICLITRLEAEQPAS